MIIKERIKAVIYTDSILVIASNVFANILFVSQVTTRVRDVEKSKSIESNGNNPRKLKRNATNQIAIK